MHRINNFLELLVGHNDLIRDGIDEIILTFPSKEESFTGVRSGPTSSQSATLSPTLIPSILSTPLLITFPKKLASRVII